MLTLTYSLSFPADNDEFISLDDARDVAFEVSMETGETSTAFTGSPPFHPIQHFYGWDKNPVNRLLSMKEV